MSFNYPMFVHNRVPPQNPAFQSSFRAHTISARSNANHDSDYSRFIPDNDYASKTLSNRYSMYNYDFAPEVVLQNKHNFRTKENEKYFSTMTPKVSKSLAKNLNFFSINSEKLAKELKIPKTETSGREKNGSKETSDDSVDKIDAKKTKVPISFIEFNRNSVCLKRKETDNKPNLTSLSTESLIKTYSKKQYDNHGLEHNKYHLNSAYNNIGENFDQIATKMSSLLDKKNAQLKKSEFSYNKFMYYNRLEEQYSSDNSEDKVDNLENLKNFFPRPSSLYYDSGICADGSNSTYIKGLRKCDAPNLEEKTFTENTVINNGSSESAKNSLPSNRTSSSSISSDLSSSSHFSSSFSSCSKQRNRMNAMFKSMNLKNPSRLNQNTFRTSFRETSKKIDLPIINLNDTKNSEIKYSNVAQSKSKIETSRADFTPHLFNKVNLLKNGKPIIRNTKVPPLPQINYNTNVCIGKNSQIQNADLNHNSSDSMHKTSLDRYKKNSSIFLSNLNSDVENFANSRHSRLRNSTNSCNKPTSNIKNNVIKIIDQTSGCEKIRVVSKSEKRCIALNDFIGLYSENLNLIKTDWGYSIFVFVFVALVILFY
ncbi:hypothetical protein BpHYR1_009958 [Brachionus plicatilis]|uniref:Uncharacterized protein n=1 Tax=Brachionus plicatilis TaxID=10195 RepID=A0A3M7QJJ9_BRAPC|nr:hypothetical protein BpHYR1_009958 [Brachionus plicatilis]